MSSRTTMRWRGLVGTGLVNLATACTVGPNFQPPHAPADDTYLAVHVVSAGAPSLTFGAAIAADWYELFRSEALNALVHEALANNPDLEAARHGLVAARADLRAVAGSALPQIDVHAGGSRSHLNGTSLNGAANTLSATGTRYSSGVTLAYSLDLFGGVRRAIESQEAQTEAARDQALNTYITLVNEVVSTAFEYARVDAQIQVTQELIDNQHEQLALTRKLEEAGKLARSDSFLAQTQFESTAASLPDLQKQRAALSNALAHLVGQTPSEFVAPQLTLNDFTLPASLPVSLPSILVRQRPDVLAAESQLHRASAEIGVAKAARFPALTLSGQISQQASKLGDLSTSAANVWSLGLDMAAPLFHGGTLSAHQRAAEARYAQSAALYRGVVVGAFVEVADSLQSLELDTTSFAAHRRALDSARASRELADAQFRAGTVSQLQVLTIEQQYQSAALLEVQVKAQRFADVASLMHALGGGWWNAPEDPAEPPSGGPVALAVTHMYSAVALADSNPLQGAFP